jgi:hypothetical protein
MGKKTVEFVSRVADAFEVFNIRGQAIVGLFTLTIIGLSVYATVCGKDLPGGVVAAYGAVIAGLTVNTTFKTPQRVPRGER